MSVGVRLELVRQVAEGLASLHNAGFVYRDMAARNVLAFSLPATDPAQVDVKITDFGLMIRRGELCRGRARRAIG